MNLLVEIFKTEIMIGIYFNVIIRALVKQKKGLKVYKAGMNICLYL